jgi:hypothetical protein
MMDLNTNQKDYKYFSIHSVNALEKREYSIIMANVNNTPEKVELALSIFPIEDWHIEYHNYKIDMRVTIM